MNKREFLASLRNGLYGLPQDDIEERLGFYAEMIDDRMEEGLTEEQAKKQAALRNLFWCESHDALMRGLMRLEYEGRVEEARASLPELLELQKIPK